jgi:hypothetical protein
MSSIPSCDQKWYLMLFTTFSISNLKKRMLRPNGYSDDQSM